MQDTQLFKTPNPSKLRPSAGASAPPENERCRILAKKGFLTAKNLTSGVAILVYSREFQLGVLLHLPSFGGTSRVYLEDDAFAKSAMTMILAEFETLGVRKKDLLTYAIGGSAADGITEASNITVRRAMWAHGLMLSACDLGGNQIRSIWMDVESGRTIVRSEPLMKSALQPDATLSVAS